MDLYSRNQRLCSMFSPDKKVVFEEERIEITPFEFVQKRFNREIGVFQQEIRPADFCETPDSHIEENKKFKYYVLNPLGRYNSERAILLLHGLNERSWEKYLIWAQELSANCDCPVILFPIAFHMNRTPAQWIAPRWVMPWLEKRKGQINNLNNASFANLALSSRLSASPLRFYTSGRESALNIIQLISDLKKGTNPLLKESCHIDLFAYSIGALLAQVLFIANPNRLFGSSKLMMFCGGSIFEKMNGNAKDIMDQKAYENIREYYLHKFINGEHHSEYPGAFQKDHLESAFMMMINKENYKEQRENFFNSIKSRIKMIMLKKDIVDPYNGAVEAVGTECAGHVIEELDFPYDYSHQTPFPFNKGIDCGLLTSGFKSVFDRSSLFLK